MLKKTCLVDCGLQIMIHHHGGPEPEPLPAQAQWQLLQSATRKAATGQREARTRSTPPMAHARRSR